MSPDSDPEKNLEHAIDRVLRELPPRRAPRSLEQRVLAEIEHRATAPWWRKSFVHWPWAAQAAFLLLSAAAMRFFVSGALWSLPGFDPMPLGTVLAGPLAWVDGVFAIGRGIGRFFDILHRNIPALWLYAGLAAIATLYGTLLGLGAAAYKAIRGPR